MVHPTIPRSASVEESSHISSITAPPLLTSASLQDIMASAHSAQRRNNKSKFTCNIFICFYSFFSLFLFLFYIANNRQDSKLSVKSLIESIENVAKQAKAGTGLTSSLASSTSSFSSLISGEHFDSQSISQQVYINFILLKPNFVFIN